MRNALIKICEVASLPFNKNKASDEYSYSKDLPNFLNSFK
jgi:hypothetical protein